MGRIVAVSTAVPPHRLDAAEFESTLARAFQHADSRRLLRMAANCGVRERYIALPVEEILAERSLEAANRRYAELCIELGERTAREALVRANLPPAAVDLVLTVSCTGYMLPSLDAHLVHRLGLRDDVVRLPVTELGCLAGAAAFARADDLLASGRFRNALLVAAELPSLTFQPRDSSMDNVVSTLVFGDGCGAAVVSADDGAGFSVVDRLSRISPHTLPEMGFELRDTGLHVVLSRDVPALLAKPFAESVSELLVRRGLAPADLAFACIHPGGPKILRTVDAALRVEGLTAPSWEVLERYGNQSSASVFFILEELLLQELPSGGHGLMAGFGPGLSLELLLLRRDV